MAQLRVVLDQLGPSATPDLADASRALLAGLAETAPRGCTLEAIVPAGVDEPIEGVASVRRLALARRELAAAWQLGVAPGVGGGMIHSPTPLAPLVRHDRLNDHDQTVPTFWDLRAWVSPGSLPRGVVAWQRGMLRRAARYADAVVVPSHAIAERLAGLAPLGDRIRVIAGAPDPRVRVPADAADRRAEASLPASYLVLDGPQGAPDALAPAFAAVATANTDVVVVDAAEGTEPAIAEIAAASGVPAARVHVRERMDVDDRAAVLAGASAFVAADTAETWPWRLLEALTLGIPVVAIESAVHRDVVADGGRIVPGAELSAALVDALEETSRRRLSVLAADRGRAFSWSGAAEQVWALHADL
ncbi:glycosyltransferase involved in cell wall biosynthesis [Microbacterium resistens]|uniref:Glycosyltransferase involved in cell wall biosynthesis n=1 Tax=Microbacterium resistens TaxID=156977 RepID=A0ABU1SAL8_9MICO|nr:glycosyltransferase [Microbacterium resistens]MDR6866298.1 glycosyltransferase involved in cell wall biosynthesis [Microbacterium resistens]